jgi:hypothetical protein
MQASRRASATPRRASPLAHECRGISGVAHIALARPRKRKCEYTKMDQRKSLARAALRRPVPSFATLAARAIGSLRNRISRAVNGAAAYAWPFDKAVTTGADELHDIAACVADRSLFARIS